MTSDRNFAVSEIFESIIGESSLAGFPALFIRFAGCNLRCAWCDTKYAYEPSYFLSYGELYHKIEASKQKFVLFTGGEPLLQPHLKELINDIVQKLGKRVILETNGSISIENLNLQVHVSLDCKPPSSLEHEKCLFSNYDLLKRTDDIKFVIGDRTDYEYSRKIIAEYDIEKRTNIIFQSAYGVLDTKQLATWIVEDAQEAKLGIQLHKYIGIK